MSQRSWEAGWEALPSYLATDSLLPSTGACVCVFTGVPSND